ncbi:MAG: tetratricopeptide repeat protein [Pseudomonadota bacterium]
MAYNRNKSLVKAQKLLQKGKIDEAIQEYLLVVENDPSDIRTLLKIGDLHAKLGNIDAANETYQKVGEHYAKDGFFLKAVAVFKQILKLDPGLIRIYVRLAELYQHLGLNSEAMKQYQVVVRHYETQGLKKESLDILKKMAELEPENATSKLKLAELYAKEGHGDESVAQFLAVAEDLKKKNNTQELARVYEKMEAAGILDESQKLELVEVYLESGEPKKALGKLRVLFQKDPKNLKILEFLARAFTELQQPEKAKSVYTEMINLANEHGLLEERDRFTAKLRALGLISAAQPIVESLPKPAPAVAPPVVAPEKPLPSSAKPVEKVFEEVEVFLQYGLMAKVCDALDQAVAAIPANEALRIKLVEVYRQVGDFHRLDAALKKSLAAAEALNLTDAVSAIQKEIGQIGAWPDQAPVAPESPPAEAAPAVPPEKSLEFSLPDVVSTGSAKEFELPPEMAAEIEGSAVAAPSPEPAPRPSAVSVPPELAETAPVIEVPPEASVSLTFEVDEEAAPEPIPAPVEPEIPAIEVSLEFEPEPGPEPTAVESHAKPKSLSKTKAAPEDLSTDLEEADFFASQGLLEEAEEVYRAILEKSPNHPEARRKLAELKEVNPAPPPVRANLEPERRKTNRITREEVALPEPEEKPVGRAPARVLEESGALFDLSEELQEEIRDLEEELARPKSSDEEVYLSPEEVISEFKKGVSRTVAKDDYATHYNLGIAYKEMGLLDEAIHEFEVAGADLKQAADCASMIGLCLLTKKDFTAAIAVYRKALAQVSPKSAEALGLAYELAEAYIGNGSVTEAYKLFARVADVDPTFRDCRRRAKELELDLGRSAPPPSAPEKASAEDKSVVKIPGKKTKISYI